MELFAAAAEFVSARPYLAFSAASLTAVWAFSEVYVPMRQRAVVQKATLPADLEGVMTVETFEKARAYSLDNNRFDMLSNFFQHAQGTAFLLGGYMPALWAASKALCAAGGYDSTNTILVSIAFLNLDSIINTVVQLPWQMWRTFVIEEKHGFNKQTLAFYAADQAKQFALNTVLLTGIVAALLKVIELGGENFFLHAWLLMLGVSVTMFAVYADYIAPLFDKFVPLPKGELRDQIEALAARLEFPLTKLYVVKGSVRSSHSNAYFYGFFKNKRIVLFDTLLPAGMKISDGVDADNDAPADSDEAQSAPADRDDGDKEKRKGCSIEEIVAVLSHELGHWSHNHVLKGFVTGQLQMLVMMYTFNLLAANPAMYQDFGFPAGEQPTLVGLMLVLGYMLHPINYTVGIATTFRTRMYEYQADRFAMDLGYANELRNALVKLNDDNLSFPVSDPLYSSLNHSHPTLLDRLEALKDKKQKKQN